MFLLFFKELYLEQHAPYDIDNYGMNDVDYDYS
jgi:hypothetical protein